MKKNKIEHYSDKEALDFHHNKKSGKIEIISSKPMTTKRDLALAYSPGVAAPVKAISKNPEAAYDYTSKGNLVAVISNGSAILGLIAGVSDVLGVFGTGIGILLSVDILINYYNQLVKEQVEVVMPRLGALLGRT